MVSFSPGLGRVATNFTRFFSSDPVDPSPKCRCMVRFRERPCISDGARPLFDVERPEDSTECSSTEPFLPRRCFCVSIGVCKQVAKMAGGKGSIFIMRVRQSFSGITGAKASCQPSKWLLPREKMEGQTRLIVVMPTSQAGGRAERRITHTLPLIDQRPDRNCLDTVIEKYNSFD